MVPYCEHVYATNGSMVFAFCHIGLRTISQNISVTLNEQSLKAQINKLNW